jgi:hypothetical protein
VLPVTLVINEAHHGIDPKAVIIDVEVEDVASLRTAASTPFTCQPNYRLNQHDRVIVRGLPK